MVLVAANLEALVGLDNGRVCVVLAEPVRRLCEWLVGLGGGFKLPLDDGLD